MLEAAEHRVLELCKCGPRAKLRVVLEQILGVLHHARRDPLRLQRVHQRAILVLHRERLDPPVDLIERPFIR